MTPLRNLSNRRVKQILMEQIRSGNPHLLREHLEKLHPGDLCGALRLCSPREKGELVNALDNERLAVLLRFAADDPGLSFELLKTAHPDRIRQVVAAGSEESASEMFRGLSKKRFEEIAKLLPEEAVRAASNARQSSGHGMSVIMTRDFMAVSDHMTAADALRMIRELKHSDFRPGRIYVIDGRETLVGMADLHKLVSADAQATEMGNLAEECPLRFFVDDEPAAAARALIRYGLDSAPVTDENNRLAGVATARLAFRHLNKEQEGLLDALAATGGSPYGGGAIEFRSFASEALRMFATLLSIIAVAAVVEAAAVAFGIAAPELLLAAIVAAVGASRFYNRYVFAMSGKARREGQLRGAALVSHRWPGVVAAGGGAVVACAAAFAAGHGARAALFAAASVFFPAIIGSFAGLFFFSASQNSKTGKTIAAAPAALGIADIATIVLVLFLSVLLF